MRAEIALAIFMCAAPFAVFSCQKSNAVVPDHSADDVSGLIEPKSNSKSSPRPRKNKVLHPHELYASWYNVPPDSLAKRRAGVAELTAAYDHLPLGAVVRVTRISTGKSVLVRITDRGVRAHRAQIDICKEAAEELGMVRDGLVRVRMELMPEQDTSIAESEQPLSHSR